jgi:histidine kinase
MGFPELLLRKIAGGPHFANRSSLFNCSSWRAEVTQLITRSQWWNQVQRPMAIEQQRYQRKLQAALDRHQVLLREVNHRVKNSLQVVSSMLHLQANAAGDQDLSETLNEAASRVNAVGRAYERLAYTADYENIDLIEYLRQIVNDLEPTVAPCKIQFDAPEAIQFAADRAILIGLIITELVSSRNSEIMAMRFCNPLPSLATYSRRVLPRDVGSASSASSTTGCFSMKVRKQHVQRSCAQ